MTSFFSRLFKLQNQNTKAATTADVSLDYDNLIFLDAEDLAEQGIAAAYEQLLPELIKHVDRPSQIEEVTDIDLPSYVIRFNGTDHVIYSAMLEGTAAESWGRAAYALFAIVNEQLNETGIRFYAINGGNDLGGMFLTPEQAQSAQAGLARKLDWPYIPELSGPYFGQYH